MSAKTSSRRNATIAAACGVLFAAMVGAAFAAVPVYKAFCQLTGYGGTVRKADAAPNKTLDKNLSVRFDTNVRDLPWTFEAEQVSQTIKIGATGLAYFKVTNNGPGAITGHAVYNVLPTQAGAYFRKLECFCFSDQTIAAGKTVEFPVVYFVDPKYATDRNTMNTGEVTLSYTFYPAQPSRPVAAAGAPPGKAASALGGTARAGL